jgi:DNA-binding transcriptional LysR family regulator
MRQINLLEGLPVFIAVAEARSFTQAARKLGITPSAASQAIRGLEQRIGTALLVRSTRSLSLTSAGSTYLQNAGPALDALSNATREVMGRSAQPEGLLRLTMPRAAYDSVVSARLVSFCNAFPKIDIELDIEGRLIDIIENGFDAGFRFGNFLAKGVTAMKVAPASKRILVAAPSYLRANSSINEPSDLSAHDAVVCRSRTIGLLDAWPLVAKSKSFRVDPKVRVIAGDLVSQIDLTLLGLGINCAPAASVASYLKEGRHRRVLPEWYVQLEPLHVYFPNKRTKSAALTAFLKHLR